MLRSITWRDDKARLNRTKHPGVTFGDAATVFDDDLSSTISDPEHSQDERRLAILEHTRKGKLLRVSHTATLYEHEGLEILVIRIISARKPTVAERMEYEEFL